MTVEYVGATTMTVDGVDVEITKVDIKDQTGRKVVKTMNRKKRARGFMRGVGEYQITATAVIPTDGTAIDWGAIEDSRITIRAPKGLNLRFEAHGLQEQPPVQEGDATVRQWRYQNTTPKAWDEADAGIWRLDESPVLLVSTFADYDSIARAYGERALPKARPTPRIEALAQSIVGTQTDPRERARLLYEWVSTQITYGGNCIGVGAVVPRDVDVVLDNKMGDCKDHATLLQALLTAVGVRSEQVLINAGELYDLPTTPVVSTVNHVINYLPDFKMYLDATAKQVPFGYLPGSAYAKPVI